MNRREIFELVQKYNRGVCSPEEISLLETWYVNETGLYHTELAESKMEADLEAVYAALPKENIETRVLPLWKRIYQFKGGRVAAAAAILLMLAAGLYFYESYYGAGHFDAGREAVIAVNDVLPGGNKATLTLADGRVINLSEARTGVVVDGSFVRYASGSPSSGPLKGGQSTTGPVSIPSLSGKGQTVGTNEQLTMSTPRGGTYQVILPDGTRVWLNAASALKFPAAFTGLVNRKVELSGEAYFEVKKDRKHPFIVVTDRQRVEVLGTHFNINSYGYEGSVKTTLLEGSVQITPLQWPEKKTVLKPGEQAIVTPQFLKIMAVDVEVATAWKNGNFLFREEQLESILNKLAYWYDVEIIYTGKKPARVMTGMIERKRKLSSVLHLIEVAGNVKFKIEGRKVYVMN